MLDHESHMLILGTFAFKHDPNKKCKGQGRPRAYSPTSSPHRNSKSVGRGSDDGGAKGTPQLTGKSPSGKANRLLCTNVKKEVAKGVGDKCAHTEQNLSIKEKSASIKINIPSTDERPM